ncbi:hypothetical protein ABTP93_20730, partial [Acinetobacter baumannii]
CPQLQSRRFGEQLSIRLPEKGPYRQKTNDILARTVKKGEIPSLPESSRRKLFSCAGTKNPAFGGTLYNTAALTVYSGRMNPSAREML